MLTVSDIAAKILSNDNMPRWAMPSIKLLLDLSGDILLDVEFLESRRRYIDRFLLHFLRHVDIFDDGFQVVVALVGGVLSIVVWFFWFF